MSAKILVVAEHDGQKLNASTAKCISCARALADAEITVIVLAADAAAVAAQAAQLAGVTRVLTVENAANLHPLAAVLAPQIAAVAAPFTHLLGPSTTYGKDLMARVAGLLEAPQVSDIMAIESATRFRRPIYAGNAILTVEASGDGKVVGTVRMASFEATAAGAAAAPIETNATLSEATTQTIAISCNLLAPRKLATLTRPDLASSVTSKSSLSA